jgi:hypothetical protein
VDQVDAETYPCDWLPKRLRKKPVDALGGFQMVTRVNQPGHEAGKAYSVYGRVKGLWESLVLLSFVKNFDGDKHSK